MIFALCTGFDRISKTIAQDKLAALPPISLLNGLVSFLYTENEGAMLNLGAGLNESYRFLIFILLISIVLAAAYIYLISTAGFNRAQLVGMFMVISGGAGNLIDRLINQGAVVDFARICLGSVCTGIFNLADVFVFAGAGLVLVATLKAEAKKEELEVIP